MEVVNPFILKNKERMIVFLDQLSAITDPNPPPGTYMEANSNHKCSDTGEFKPFKFPFGIVFSNAMFCLFFFHSGRELATLHHICVSYLPELQRIAKTNVSIKKLVTVTDMLTKHKLKYREMIS